jgi:hypothetical protein
MRERKEKRQDSNTLIQCVIPSNLANWVKKTAKTEGLTVSGFLRRLVIREHSKVAT